jgi:hypothetical protein
MAWLPTVAVLHEQAVEKEMIRLPRYVLFLAVLFCFPTLVFADPLFAFEKDGIRVVLTNDPCKLSEVSNLPYRATWEEKGQTFEGCWSPSFDRQRVNAFFVSDKSVVSFPPQMFSRVQGA